MALFPEFDQNRGIRRAIPLDYDGHPTDLVVESVTDATGAPRGFETEADEAGEFLLVTVRADDFVHGEQTYVITLPPAQRDVRARRRGDRRVLLGRERHRAGRQPFGRVRAELRMSPRPRRRASPGDAACYRGSSGSTHPVRFARHDRRHRPWSSPKPSALGPFENLSFAVGFRDGTFEPRDESFGASAAAITGAVGAALRLPRHARRPSCCASCAGATTPAAARSSRSTSRPRAQRDGGRRPRRTRGQGRHRDDPRTRGRRRAAGRRDRAQEVRGGLRRRRARRSATRSRSCSRSTAATPYPGARRELKSQRHRPRPAAALAAPVGAQAGRAVGASGDRPDLGIRVLLAIVCDRRRRAQRDLRHLRARRPARRHRGRSCCSSRRSSPPSSRVVAVADVRPLTERGRAARDHLEGLRLYIRLAEADRLRVLQSPSGALRVGAAGAGAAAAAADDARRGARSPGRARTRLRPRC